MYGRTFIVSAAFTVLIGACSAKKSAGDAEGGGAGKTALADCIDPDLTLVSNEVELTLCNGETATGQLDVSNCNEDGDVGCITTNAFKAVDMSAVKAANIKAWHGRGISC